MILTLGSIDRDSHIFQEYIDEVCFIYIRSRGLDTYVSQGLYLFICKWRQFMRSTLLFLVYIYIYINCVLQDDLYWNIDGRFSWCIRCLGVILCGKQLRCLPIYKFTHCCYASVLCLLIYIYIYIQKQIKHAFYDKSPCFALCSNGVGVCGTFNIPGFHDTFLLSQQSNTIRHVCRCPIVTDEST